MKNNKFKWGVATSAYQIEGAVHQDGRTNSICDTFCHTPGKVLGNDDGDRACDHYNKMEEDVLLMKALGIYSYRFSVSWNRIVPNGVGKINQKGVDFCKRLIDKLLENNIEPFITLYHWDLPQVLHDKGG